MRDGTGACGQGSRSWAREAGPAQERAHPQGCGCSLEARPLRTTAELWQVHPKGTRDAERRSADLECGAGPDRNRRVGRRAAGTY